MKNITRLVLLLLACGAISARYLKLDGGENYSYSMSSSKRSYYSSNSSSGKDGKPESHVRSISEEKYDKQVGDKPKEIRMYGEVYRRDNEEPGKLKQRAGTNVKDERKLLGDGLKISELDLNKEKEHFKDLYGDFNKSFDDLDSQIAELNESEDPFKNYGKYGKFLNSKAKHRLV